MITDFFLNLIYYIAVYPALVIFPVSAGMPQVYLDSIAAITGKLSIFEPVLPISTVLFLIPLIFAVDIAKFGYDGILWVYGLVRGSKH